MDRVQNAAVTEDEENKSAIFHKKHNKNYDNNSKSNRNNNFKSPTNNKTHKKPLNTSSDSRGSGSSDNNNYNKKYQENSTNNDKFVRGTTTTEEKKSKNVKKYQNIEDFKFPYEKYTKEANYHDENDDITDDSEHWHQESHKRVRRAAQRQKDDNRNTCSLYIQTDPLIWRHIREGVADVSRSLIFLSDFYQKI